MPPRNPGKRSVEVDLPIGVFVLSVILVVVCLIVIGVFTASNELSDLKTFCQGFLALDALVFFTACAISYAALRNKSKAQQSSYRVISENVFFVALVFFLVFICGLIVSGFILS